MINLFCASTVTSNLMYNDFFLLLFNNEVKNVTCLYGDDCL